MTSSLPNSLYDAITLPAEYYLPAIATVGHTVVTPAEYYKMEDYTNPNTEPLQEKDFLNPQGTVTSLGFPEHDDIFHALTGTEYIPLTSWTEASPLPSMSELRHDLNSNSDMTDDSGSGYSSGSEVCYDHYDALEEPRTFLKDDGYSTDLDSGYYQAELDPHHCHPMNHVIHTVETHQTYGPAQKKKPGRKKGQTSKVLHLWEFIRDLLNDPAFCGDIITWENKQEGVFRVVKSSEVAHLWGKKKKNKKAMTYEKMSRSMRYSRKEGYFIDLPKNCGYPKKLCFRFGPKSTGWQ